MGKTKKKQEADTKVDGKKANRSFGARAIKYDIDLNIEASFGRI